MGVKSVIFCLIILTTGLNQALAQPVKKDTVYYLLDTLHTPVAERMIKTGVYKQFKFYHIQCPCLSGGVEPVFRCNSTIQSYIDKRAIKSLKVLSLPDLIQYIKKNDNDNFDKQHIVFFLEASGSRFIKRQSFFQGSKVIIAQ